MYRYRAEDAAAGRVEHELDHVLGARIDAATPLHPDPAEVGELRWVTRERLAADLVRHAEDYAPWFTGVLAVWTAGSSRPSAPSA